MAERPAINASPLSFLARGEMRDLLQLVGPEVVVPAAVAAEIQRRESAGVTAQALANTPWLTVVETLLVPEFIQAWDLGEGKSAVLAWAYTHQDTEAIVDDLAARRCAVTLGMPVRGMLGLVLTAKRRGHIPEACPVVEWLRQAGMYRSTHVMQQALALVEE